MALDDFEKELFDDLDGYQSNLNLDQEWQELEERMPTKKKRRFLIWWFSGLAILVLMTSIVFYNNKNTNTTTIANIDSKTTLNANDEISKQNSATEIKQQNSIINTKPLTTKNKSFSNKVVPRISSSTNSVSTISDRNEQPSILKNQNHIFSQNVISKKPQTELNQKVTAAFPKTVPPKPMEKINISNLSSLNFYLKIADSEIEIQNDYYKKYVTPTPPKEKSKANWSMAFGYTYGANKFKRKSSVVDLQNQIDFLTGYEKQVDYMGAQLKLYRNLNKHFSVFSGIHVSQQTNLFQLRESFEVERSSSSTLLEEHYLLTGLIQQIYGQGITEYDVTIQSKLWQQYQSIAIPLGISIHNDLNKKWSFQNDLALMVHPFQNIKGRKIIKTDSDYFIFDNNTYTSKVFTSLNNQLSLNWKIANHFSLQLSADMGIDLSSRLKTEEQYDLRFSYIGVGLGGKYSF